MSTWLLQEGNKMNGHSGVQVQGQCSTAEPSRAEPSGALTVAVAGDVPGGWPRPGKSAPRSTRSSRAVLTAWPAGPAVAGCESTGTRVVTLPLNEAVELRSDVPLASAADLLRGGPGRRVKHTSEMRK